MKIQKEGCLPGTGGTPFFFFPRWGGARVMEWAGFGLREEISMNEDVALYRAVVKVWDPAAGEWVVTAEAVDTLEGLVSWAALGVGASAESRGGGGESDPFFALVAGAAVRVVAPPYRAEDIAVYIRESFGLSDEELVSVVPVAGGESATWSVLESFMWRDEQEGLSAAERVQWQQIARRFLYHPYGSFLNPA